MTFRGHRWKKCYPKGWRNSFQFAAFVMLFKILSVVGARPNFMKVAAICEAIKGVNSLGAEEQIRHVVVHTGQHYDHNMSDSFFNDLELPKPDLCLGVGSASHSVQTARIMERFESVVVSEQPHLVLVV